ncbi:hypothetical protein C3L33_04174, partial [Rhododendron williamsianum]
MKIRSIKLREAHKNSNGAGSFCSILWDLQAQHIVTSSSSDPRSASTIPSCFPARPGFSATTATASPPWLSAPTPPASPPDPSTTPSSSTSFQRTELKENGIVIYNDGGEFQTNITRFTLPIRVLGFNKSGSMLAAAGDDEGIKLINTIDGSIARVLKGHRGSVTGLGFDPKSEYLASLDSAGTVIVWELQSGRALHTLKGIAPDTAEKLFSLRGDHVQRICFLSWSPNGKYMATSGLDRQVLIWDVDQRLDIDRQKFDDVICCMAWKPTGNALAVIDAMGKYGIWDSAVPSSMKSPTEGIPDLQSKNSNGSSFLMKRRRRNPIYLWSMRFEEKKLSVTAVGFGDELAVVTHASPSLPSNDQMLEFRVFNIRHGTQPIRGRLPVTPGSYLTWFGFSEEGKICTFDSKGVLRVFTDQYGGSWLPLFSSTKVRKPEENHWVVGLNAIKLFCVVCKSPDTFPQVIPKPVLNLMDLSFPLASSDLGADNLENEFILHNLHLSQINKTIEEMMSTGQDTTSLDDEAFNMDASLDRCIFKLIASCCNGEFGYELVKLLSFEKSVKGAIELAKSLKLPNLAERFTTIQEERLLNESKAATAFPVTNLGSDTSDKSDFAIRKSIPPLESSYDSKPAIPSPSQKLPSPPFMKKVLSEAVAKAGKAKVKQGQAANLENIGEVKNDVQLKNAGEVKNVEVKKTGEENNLQTRPSNSFAKSSDVQLKNAGEVKNAEVKKTGEAKNPFAKSSNKQEKSSLFDSLKKKNVK